MTSPWLIFFTVIAVYALAALVEAKILAAVACEHRGGVLATQSYMRDVFCADGSRWRWHEGYVEESAK